jgi:hypothetical protein
MNTFRRIPIASLTIIGMVASALAPSSLRAQQPGTAPALSGTWIQTIHLQGEAPFQGLVTFNADGTLTDTDQVDVAPPDLASPGHGVWVSSATNTVRFKLVKFLSLASTPGVPDGMTVSNGTLTMQDSNDFQSSGVAIFFSAEGQPALTVPFTSVGKRITVD